MERARMQSRCVMIVLIGSLAATIALAAVGPHPQIVTKLATSIGRWLALQLALATMPSHDPRHPASTFLWSEALDRAFGGHLVTASGDDRTPTQLEPVGLASPCYNRSLALVDSYMCPRDETAVWVIRELNCRGIKSEKRESCIDALTV